MTIFKNKNFRISISEKDISKVLSIQINNMVADVNQITAEDIVPYVNLAFKKIYTCFKGINNKYYKSEGEVLFDHLHSDHYCTFLYFVSNAAYLEKDYNVATKLFLLNKYLHGIDLYFSVKLPEIFMLVHPLGSIVGNAEYSNKIVIYQNCTIGSIFKEDKYVYPKFSEGVVLYAKTSIIGDCKIGSKVIFGANSFVINTNIPNKSLVTGSSPDLRVTSKEDINIHFFL